MNVWEIRNRRTRTSPEVINTHREGGHGDRKTLACKQQPSDHSLMTTGVETVPEHVNWWSEYTKQDR